MASVFDIRTLFLAASMTGLASAAAIFAMRRMHAHSSDAAVWASLALASAGASMLGIAFRGEIPDFFSFTLANWAGTATFPLLYESVRRLCRVAPRPWTALMALLLMLAYQLTLDDGQLDVSARVVVSSLYGATYSAMMIPLLLRRTSRDPRAAVIGSIALVAAFLVAHLARAGSVLYADAATSTDGRFLGGVLHTIVGLVFTLVPMLFAMCLMYWINGRVGSELRRHAATDELTGLVTRRRLFARARESLEVSGEQAPRVRTVGMLMIDLDYFKKVNDRYGHQVGDEVLAHAAATLRHALRPEDELGRYGGEEFCAIVERPSRADIRAVAEALCDAVRGSPYVEDEETIGLSVSIGMATDDEFTGFEEMLAAADRLLYRAKALGRDRVADSDTAPPRFARRAGDLREPGSPAPDPSQPVVRVRGAGEDAPHADAPTAARIDAQEHPAVAG